LAIGSDANAGNLVGDAQIGVDRVGIEALPALAGFSFDHQRVVEIRENVAA
jgi:hypothetical protein